MDLSKHAFFEGIIVPLSDANINIATHAFLYGTAVFGGMRAYWNEEKQRLFVFRPYDHFRRLLHSAHMMAMQTSYDEESLIQLTLDLLRTDNWQQDVYMRPTFYKADLGIGVRLHHLRISCDRLRQSLWMRFATRRRSRPAIWHATGMNSLLGLLLRWSKA